MDEETTGFEDRLDFLDEEDDWEEPEIQQEIDEFWKPEVGDQIVGIFLEIRGFVSQAGEHFKKYIFQSKDREGTPRIVAVATSKFLDQRLSDIAPGDGVKIKFLGKEQSKKDPKNKYNVYDVHIKKFSQVAPNVVAEKNEQGVSILKTKEQIRQITDVLMAEGKAINTDNIIAEAGKALEAEIDAITPEEYNAVVTYLHGTEKR